MVGSLISNTLYYNWRHIYNYTIGIGLIDSEFNFD